MKFGAVLFDLDGTLLNSLDDLADSMNAVLDRFGFPKHDPEAYKLFVGDGLVNLVLRSLPQEQCAQEAVTKMCVEYMRKEYARRWNVKTRPYEGVPELLDLLTERSLPMSVLSNKPDEFTKMAVGELLSRWRFEQTLGERPSIPRKPDPASALEIARFLRIPPEAFLYVGDTSTDMMTAGAAGMHAVGALWGFRGAGELSAGGAKILIERPTDLMNLL